MKKHHLKCGRFQFPHGTRFLVVGLAILLAAGGLAYPASTSAGGRRQQPIDTPPAMQTVVFMTDFGLLDDSVAICKAVMLGIAPGLRIEDLTHQVRPYAIADAARFLAGTTPYYKKGTVFVVVVDPGVGSSRKPIVVKSKRGQYFVVPDNGLMTLVEARDGIESAREITNPLWMIGTALSSTFHGRDIFSPVGAHLARGDDWTQVGPEIKDLVRLNISVAKVDREGINGELIALDGPYGNMVSNIDGSDFRKLGYAVGDNIRVRVGANEMKLPFVKTFSDVPLKSPLLYIDSRGRLGLAVNQGSFAEVYSVSPPMRFYIPRKTK